MPSSAAINFGEMQAPGMLPSQGWLYHNSKINFQFVTPNVFSSCPLFVSDFKNLIIVCLESTPQMFDVLFFYSNKGSPPRFNSWPRDGSSCCLVSCPSSLRPPQSCGSVGPPDLACSTSTFQHLLPLSLSFVLTPQRPLKAAVSADFWLFMVKQFPPFKDQLSFQNFLHVQELRIQKASL